MPDNGTRQQCLGGNESFAAVACSYKHKSSHIFFFLLLFHEDIDDFYTSFPIRKMYVSTATFTLPPDLAPFSAPLKTFQESYDIRARLVVGAFIFSSGRSNTSSPQADEDVARATPEPRMLLLHRASADAYGDLWDFPGGSAEKTDESIVDAVKREVMEETGLHVSEVVECVGMHTWIDTQPGRNTKWAKFSFTVKVAEESEGVHPEVKLAEAEHQAFMWATEEDIRAGLEEREGALKFIAMEEIEIAAEAFKIVRDLDRQQ
jgi:8-oxo-dGTP pyrophosphatase MutT (NUDIX family)